jgi:hypothetical protein
MDQEEGPSGGRLDPATYLSVLDRWIATLDDGAAPDGTATPPPFPAHAPHLALPRSWPVVVEGAVIEVPTQWLQEGLRRAEARPESAACVARDLRARLEALRREAAAAGTGPIAPLTAARNRLDTILSRREFRDLLAPGPIDRLRERLAARLLDLLEALFGKARARVAVWKGLIGAAIAFGLVAVVAVLARRAARARSRPALDPGRSAPAGRPASRDWSERAIAAARAGRHREAVRCGYAAALHRLDESGILPFDEAGTHREHLRRMPAGHALRGPFLDLTQRFERVWYARREASEEDVSDTMALMERLGCAPLSTPAISGS